MSTWFVGITIIHLPCEPRQVIRFYVQRARVPRDLFVRHRTAVRDCVHAVCTACAMEPMPLPCAKEPCPAYIFHHNPFAVVVLTALVAPSSVGLKLASLGDTCYAIDFSGMDRGAYALRTLFAVLTSTTCGHQTFRTRSIP